MADALTPDELELFANIEKLHLFVFPLPQSGTYAQSSECCWAAGTWPDDEYVSALSSQGKTDSLCIDGTVWNMVSFGETPAIAIRRVLLKIEQGDESHS